MRRAVSDPVPPLQRKRTKGSHFVGDGIALVCASEFPARPQVPSSAFTAIRPVRLTPGGLQFAQTACTNHLPLTIVGAL